MADDPDADDVVTAAQDGVRVEKCFTADEFPVPAVKFVLRSETDDAVEVRLTDDIPESFGMEGIGFHPEYDADAWTAYGDHRVEYERTLDPGEEVTTVYGVRLDDPGTGDRFLAEPRVELLSPDEERPTPEEVLGRETTREVRDALAGEDELAPAAGGSDESTAAVDTAASTSAPDGPPPDADLDLHEPASSEADATEAETARDAADTIEDPAEADPTAGDAAAGPRPVDDGLTPVLRPSAATASQSTSDAADADVETEDETAGGRGGPGAVPGSVVAALAAEIRDGRVDDDDLAVLRDAVDPGTPRSVEVRIDRLQNRTEDLAAYTDALEEFIDEEGTAREVLGEIEAETASVREDLDAVATDLDDAAEERATLEAETADLADEVGSHDDRLTDVETDVTELEGRVASLDGDLDGVRAAVADVEASVEDLAGDTEGSLAAVEDALDDVEATVADLEDEIEDLHSFRDRMREAFGS